MKKIKLLSIAALLGILLIAQTSQAVPFSDTVEFGGTPGSIEITDSYSYTHTLTGLNSTSYILNDATLTLRHNGNSNNTTGELWYTYGDSSPDILIGQLYASSGSMWVEQVFTLGADILSLMSGTDPWSLTVLLNETTNGTDKLKIDWSTLSGNYGLLPKSIFLLL